MALKRMILEIGMGNDLHGGDYTKAAVRAVLDAVHHSSLSMIRSLGLDWKDVHITITIGAQDPDAVDPDAVSETLPGENVTVKSVKGGLDIPDPGADDLAVIATAAVEVFVDLP